MFWYTELPGLFSPLFSFHKLTTPPHKFVVFLPPPPRDVRFNGLTHRGRGHVVILTGDYLTMGGNSSSTRHSRWLIVTIILDYRPLWRAHTGGTHHSVVEIGTQRVHKWDNESIFFWYRDGTHRYSSRGLKNSPTPFENLPQIVLLHKIR